MRSVSFDGKLRTLRPVANAEIAQAARKLIDTIESSSNVDLSELMRSARVRLAASGPYGTYSPPGPYGPSSPQHDANSPHVGLELLPVECFLIPILCLL